MRPDVLVWRLKPQGTCGVGDHSRGMAKHGGGQVVDVSQGQTPGSDFQVLQYVPQSWTQTLGWAGPLLRLLDAHPAKLRVLWMHELWRGPLLGLRTCWPAVHDLWALRSLLPRVHALVTTTENRAHLLRELMAPWPVKVPVHVHHVASNIHEGDGAPQVSLPTAPPKLAVFARGGGGVDAQALAAVLALVAKARPDVELVLLGERGHPLQDPLTKALQACGVLENITVTGLQPGPVLARTLSHCRLGLSLHDTGVSGRRGTVAAMLASGLPVVTSHGVETCDLWHHTLGVALATAAQRPSAGAVAQAVCRLLDEPARAHTARRQAALTFYRQHGSWSAWQNLWDGLLKRAR